MQTVVKPAPDPSRAAPGRRRVALLQRPWARRFIARHAKHIWGGPLMPLAGRMPPRLVSRIAAALDPDDFALSIAQTPDERLAAVMQAPLRDIVLDEVVRRMQDEFRPERATGMDAVIELDITGRADGGRDIYQLVIRDNTCASHKGGGESPKATIELGGVDFLKLVSGIERGMDLYLAGRLKFDGQAMMLTRLTSMFSIPEAPPVTAR